VVCVTAAINASLVPAVRGEQECPFDESEYGDGTSRPRHHCRNRGRLSTTNDQVRGR
jgi:hypothetical protein